VMVTTFMNQRSLSVARCKRTDFASATL